MKLQLSGCLTLVAACFLSANTFASVDTMNVKEGTVSFVATGKPSALKIKGEGTGIAGKLNLENQTVVGTIQFPLTSLDTGVELRNRHMKEKYLETGKFPQAQLTIKNLKLPQSPKVNGFHATSIPFTGELAVHGITKPIQGTVDLSNKEGEVVGDANFHLKISDYGINVPTYLGITVADDVAVTTHFKAF